MSGEQNEFPGVQVEEEQSSGATLDYIVDVDEREKFFKARLAHLYTESEAICKLISPITETNYEYLLVVAVPSGKIFPFATPGLKPMVATDHGKKLISTLLETNLKRHAEEGDPEREAKDAAALARAKEKEQKANEKRE